MRSELLTPPPERPTDVPLAQSVAVPYPAVTTADGTVHQADGAHRRVSKRVVVEPRPWLDEPLRVVSQITDAVGAGAAVLVVMNTVDRAVGLLRACESVHTIERALFTSAGRICPHHGRFARADRLLLDAEVSRRFGNERKSGGLLLIGTQTLEQSLDIDADLLVTDLCPMDVLLQRIGRLHRHNRNDRPDGFTSPRCVVLTPADRSFDGFFSEGRVRSRAGIGSVYADLRMSKLTSDIIGEGREVSIPDECRSLVEGAVHPENLEQLVEGPWRRHRQELLGAEMARKQAGEAASLNTGLAFGDREMRFGAMDERIETRLGLDDRTISFDRTMRSPFGRSFDEITVPGWMAPDAGSDMADVAAEQHDNGVVFAWGDRRFQYTRYGLERT